MSKIGGPGGPGAPAAISQKEYLQKYLSGKKKDPSKKKKRQKAIGKGIKIIDDDLDLTKMRSLDENELELFMQNEDAPQVVGIVDERAEEVKTLESYKQTNKWKLMSQDDEIQASIKIEKNKYNDDSDLSPPRNVKNEDSDLSPERNPRRTKRSDDSDLSPPRMNRRKGDSDESPPRNKRIKQERQDSDGDLSPPRRRSRERSKYSESKSKSDSRKQDSRQYTKDDRNNRTKTRDPKKSRWGREDDRERENSYQDEGRNSNKRGDKMDKTLDGKRAGLQDARQLKHETDNFRKREDEMFSKLSEDVTGRHATTIKRNVKGKYKETEEDIAAKKEREERQKQLEIKYSRWGKGIKQTEEQESRIQEFLHEASKPLARYKDDDDLDKQLRNVERLDDPMLEYMRKKSSAASGANAQVYPLYKGPYPANRFNLRPGYRWDGVDRSNGYEKRYFETKSAKVANEEEAYKWSTEDM